MAVGTPARDRRAEVVTIIEADRPPSSMLRELIQYFELVYFFAWRDVKVRYKQAVIGIAWAVLQPLVMMAIFTVVLGRLAGVPSDGLPYALFAFTGLLPWVFFANAVNAASDSLVRSQDLIQKVWFPRLALPLAGLLAYLPDIAIASVVLVALMALYGVAPVGTALLLPVFVLLAVLAAAAVSVWLAALNVAYRDVKYALPFLIQIWLFATPVLYPASMLPERLLPLYALNPMAGVVEGFRWALFGAGEAPWALVGISGAVAVVVLASGLWYFQRVEGYFADVV